MRTRARRILEFPALFVFLSFLFGLSKFVDVFLRLLFQYMLAGPYPLAFDMKPVIFLLQTISLLLFIYYVATHWLYARIGFRKLLGLHLTVLVIVTFLFVIYEFINPGKYGSIIYYTDTLWLISYIVGLSVTCFWFSHTVLRKTRYRPFVPVFLLLGSAFILRVISEVVFWPQTLFNVSLPSEVDVGSRLLVTLFMLSALLYTGIVLAFRKGLNRTSASILRSVKPYVLIAAFLVPFSLNYYKEGLFPLIIRAVVFWGLGYSGQDWYFASMYLVAFAVYVFLVIYLYRRLNGSVASSLILLAVMSFPWNGVIVYDFGYSSIPGNALSLIALITGFLMLSQHREVPMDPDVTK